MALPAWLLRRRETPTATSLVKRPAFSPRREELFPMASRPGIRLFKQAPLKEKEFYARFQKEFGNYLVAHVEKEPALASRIAKRWAKKALIAVKDPLGSLVYFGVTWLPIPFMDDATARDFARLVSPKFEPPGFEIGERPEYRHLYRQWVLPRLKEFLSQRPEYASGLARTWATVPARNVAVTRDFLHVLPYKAKAEFLKNKTWLLKYKLSATRRAINQQPPKSSAQNAWVPRFDPRSFGLRRIPPY